MAISFLIIIGVVGGCTNSQSSNPEITLNHQFMKCIRPKCVNQEEWQSITDRPIEYGGPYQEYMTIENILVPTHPVIGEIVNIRVTTEPKAFINIELRYRIKEAFTRIEYPGRESHYDGIDQLFRADDSGIVNVSWLVSEDIDFQDTSSQLIYMFISIFPPEAGITLSGYAEPNWQQMSLAAVHLSGFNVYTD